MSWTPSDKPAVTLADSKLAAMSKNERLKTASQGLFFVAGPKGEVHAFGSEIDALSRGEAETLSNEAKELSKFFGIYKQQERGERGKKTDDYSFMVRIKAPAGGAFSPRAVGRARRGRREVCRRHAAHHVAPGDPVPPRLRAEARPAGAPPESPLPRRGHARRLRRREPQRDVLADRGARPRAPHGRPRARARDRRGARAAHERLLPGVPVGRGGPQRRAHELRRALVRRALSAAEVQDRDRPSDGQLRRRADAGRRLRAGREEAAVPTASSGISTAAAGSA